MYMNVLRIQKIPLAISFLHLLVCLFVNAAEFEGSWKWFIPFTLDLPFSLLVVMAPSSIHPLFLYGVLGSIWWYFLVCFLSYLICKIRSKLKA